MPLNQVRSRPLMDEDEQNLSKSVFSEICPNTPKSDTRTRSPLTLGKREVNKTQAPIEVKTSPLGLAMQRIGLQIGRDTGSNLNYLIQPRGPSDMNSTFAERSMTKSNKSKVKKQKASLVSNRSNLSSNRR